MEILTQRVELLSVAPGEAPSGERTVVLTIRPYQNSFRPHNIALSRTQAIRLLKSLKIVLRQSVGVLLVGLALASLSGCSAEVQVVTEQTATRGSAEAAQSATEERVKTDVAVRLLDQGRPSPVENKAPVTPTAAAPLPEPKKPVEIVGDGNAVLVVEGDLHLHRHVHIHEAPWSERLEIDIPRYDGERDERCERLRREYEAKVRQLRRIFYE